jgi:hypothetical protein
MTNDDNDQVDNIDDTDNPATDNGEDIRDERPVTDAADARVDEVARSAGNELRRPAPELGLAGVQRARRRRQIARGAVGSTAALAFVVGGFIVANRDDNPQITTTNSGLTTTAVPNTTTPSTTIGTTDTSTPVEPVPNSAVPSSPPANLESVVYTSDQPFIPLVGSVQTLLNSVDGSAVGNQAVDPEQARLAQDPFVLQDRSIVDLGDVTYDFIQARGDGGSIDTGLFPDVDLCEQNRVTVTSPSGSALPERARLMRVSPDDRFVVTLSVACPEVGTLGLDGVVTQLPYEFTLQVFDAQRPELPGRVLAEIRAAASPSALTASPNGRFISIETFGLVSRYRIFDLESATEIDLGLDAGADCNLIGTRYARFMGPWIGDSSIAVTAGCPTASTLHVLDLADPENRLSVPFPGPTGGGYTSMEVDYATFTDPQDVLFTMCDARTPMCWIGHGSEPLIELPGVAQASFLPLGFEYGG